MAGEYIIKRPEDYYYVQGANVTAECPHGDLDRIKMDGWIMPRRNPGHPGHSEVTIRGEDLSILMESVFLRRALTGLSTNPLGDKFSLCMKSDVVDHMVDSLKLIADNSKDGQYARGYARFINRDKFVSKLSPVSHEPYVVNGSLDPDFTSPDYHSSYYDSIFGQDAFTIDMSDLSKPGRVLSKNRMKELFECASRLDYFCFSDFPVYLYREAEDGTVTGTEYLYWRYSTVRRATGAGNWDMPDYAYSAYKHVAFIRGVWVLFEVYGIIYGWGSGSTYVIREDRKTVAVPIMYSRIPSFTDLVPELFTLAGIDYWETPNVPNEKTINVTIKILRNVLRIGRMNYDLNWWD